MTWWIARLIFRLGKLETKNVHEESVLPDGSTDSSFLEVQARRAESLAADRRNKSIIMSNCMSHDNGLIGLS
ncbi:hypothetical protein CEXT_93451 [Caerostris extrusa]|uniref:Uncharacterized protein n=1 Tax=Caerostris extrusa TaxID=172846 RepID=A0AAV4U213_CAEEX|nr:hypothetical protein CEXT_93451 [Caerostris extrusa]